LKLFESTKLILQNNKKLQELVQLVQELLTWFADNKDTLIKKPQESATVFMEYVKKLVLHMKQMLTKKDLARFWDLAQNLPVTA